MTPAEGDEAKGPGACRRRRIHIIGRPGSGKSFIAARLSRRSGLPVFDLDDLFWDPGADRYDVRTPAAERDAALARILEGSEWIIEGVYYGWLSRSFEAADRIVVLAPSVWTRDARIVRRFLRRTASLVPSRRESPADLWRLLRWSPRYDVDHLGPARESIAHLRHKIVECASLRDVLSALEA